MKNKNIQNIFCFNSSFDFNGYRIEYTDLMEICQGGPVVGNLYINEKLVSCNRYGGPLLLDNEFIFLTIFSGSKFILTEVRICDFESRFIGNYRDIICLREITYTKISFYDSIYDTSLKYYDLSAFKISNQGDTPNSFSTELVLNKHSFQFDEIKAVSKDSKVACLTIDGKRIDTHQFGSPFLYNNSQILIPIYLQGFFRSGFKLALIDLNDFSIDIRGEKEKMIFLNSFENCNKVIYYKDLSCNIRKAVMI